MVTLQLDDYFLFICRMVQYSKITLAREFTEKCMNSVSLGSYM